MDDVATKIVGILKKNMKEPPETIALDTKLSDLDIESLDLAVIVFDIEDTFGIQIPYNANEEMQDFATVGSVVDRVKSLISGTLAGPRPDKPPRGGPHIRTETRPRGKAGRRYRHASFPPSHRCRRIRGQ